MASSVGAADPHVSLADQTRIQLIGRRVQGHPGRTLCTDQASSPCQAQVRRDWRSGGDRGAGLRHIGGIGPRTEDLTLQLCARVILRQVLLHERSFSPNCFRPPCLSGRSSCLPSLLRCLPKFTAPNRPVAARLVLVLGKTRLCMETHVLFCPVAGLLG